VPPSPRRAGKLGLLLLFYFVQGLPFGFQSKALPIYLRSHGSSLAGVGLASALAAPWMLKALWAPLVDRYGSARLGRRLSWIAPCLAGLAITAGAAALVPPETALSTLLALVLLMNFFAATMDIAVDGLAVDLLEPGELGLGNASQVVGYKLGMLTGGGLLVWASQWIGWSGLFAAVAALVLTALVIALAAGERPTGAPSPAREHTSMREVLSALRRSLRAEGAWIVLAVVATYKLGEAMADAMFTPFLVDRGVSAGDIGLWLGTYGMAFSMAGSFAGGLLASRTPVLRVLAIAGALRVAPLAYQAYLTTVQPSAAEIVLATSAEHLFGGAMTTAMFAFMMARVDRSIGATHFAVLATIEVLGKSPGTWASGFLADAVGYTPVFVLATVISAAFLALLGPAARRDAARAA
jgi:MFS family permease